MFQSLCLNDLESMVSLPCRINESHILLETPILARAVKSAPYIFRHEVLCGESLLTFLDRIYQNSVVYNMDCSVYAQLVSLVLSGKWPTNGGKINLALCADADGSNMVWDCKIPQMGYFSVKDKETHELIQTAPITSKGQWCVQISENKFLGLARDGPRVLTMEEWVSRLMDGIKQYVADDPRNSLISSQDYLRHCAIKGIIICSIKLGKFDKWGFFDVKGFPSIVSKQTIDGIVLKQKQSDNMKHFLSYVSKTEYFCDHHYPQILPIGYMQSRTGIDQGRIMPPCIPSHKNWLSSPVPQLKYSEESQDDTENFPLYRKSFTENFPLYRESFTDEYSRLFGKITMEINDMLSREGLSLDRYRGIIFEPSIFTEIIQKRCSTRPAEMIILYLGDPGVTVCDIKIPHKERQYKFRSQNDRYKYKNIPFKIHRKHPKFMTMNSGR